MNKIVEVEIDGCMKQVRPEVLITDLIYRLIDPVTEEVVGHCGMDWLTRKVASVVT